MEITLSSAKRGYGLSELLSASNDEYWETSDVLPHTIHISFRNKTYIYAISLGLSFLSDDSYTPEKVVVFTERRSKAYYWHEPVGHKEIKINEHLFDIYIVIEKNHSEGRDSHVRGLRIFISPEVEYGTNQYLLS